MGKVKFHQAAVNQLLKSPSGLVYKDIARRTLKVHGAARRKVGVNTGRLRSSIRWVMKSDNKGPYGLVGTDVEYAAVHHEGSRPHVIRAKNGKALYWKGAKHPVRSVNHPGTKPNHFLTDALKEAQ